MLLSEFGLVPWSTLHFWRGICSLWKGMFSAHNKASSKTDESNDIIAKFGASYASDVQVLIFYSITCSSCQCTPHHCKLCVLGIIHLWGRSFNSMLLGRGSHILAHRPSRQYDSYSTKVWHGWRIVKMFSLFKWRTMPEAQRRDLSSTEKRVCSMTPSRQTLLIHKSTSFHPSLQYCGHHGNSVCWANGWQWPLSRLVYSCWRG